MTATIPVPKTNVTAIIPIHTGFIFLSSFKIYRSNKKPVVDLTDHGFAKIPSCLPSGRCFGNPAIPGAWDPWLSPPSIFGEAGPPEFIGTGVPRLLVVWLYRQFRPIQFVLIMIRAISMPKLNCLFNHLILKCFLKITKIVEKEKVPFFVLKKNHSLLKSVFSYCNTVSWEQESIGIKWSKIM
jgi:hypothetical protein